MYTPLQRAEILRDTLKRVQESAGLKPEDPALIELKRVILSKVIELEHEVALEAPEIPLGFPVDAN